MGETRQEAPKTIFGIPLVDKEKPLNPEMIKKLDVIRRAFDNLSRRDLRGSPRLFAALEEELKIELCLGKPGNGDLSRHEAGVQVLGGSEDVRAALTAETSELVGLLMATGPNVVSQLKGAFGDKLQTLDRVNRVTLMGLETGEAVTAAAWVGEWVPDLCEVPKPGATVSGETQLAIPKTALTEVSPDSIGMLLHTRPGLKGLKPVPPAPAGTP